jgi:hypothetical protein
MRIDVDLPLNDWRQPLPCLSQTYIVDVTFMSSSWPYGADDPDQQDRADEAANQVAEPSP